MSEEKLRFGKIACSFLLNRRDDLPLYLPKLDIVDREHSECVSIRVSTRATGLQDNFRSIHHYSMRIDSSTLRL